MGTQTITTETNETFDLKYFKTIGAALSTPTQQVFGLRVEKSSPSGLEFDELPNISFNSAYVDGLLNYLIVGEVTPTSLVCIVDELQSQFPDSD